MAFLTPEDEQILTKLQADAAKAALLPDDTAQCLTARTREPLGLNAQGEPFKPEDLVNIFADMEPEDSAAQALSSLASVRK